MRLSSDVSTAGKTVRNIRVDQIGGASGLWWVAEEFTDGSAKPEGMFPGKADALALADQLAAEWKVSVRISAAA